MLKNIKISDMILIVALSLIAQAPLLYITSLIGATIKDETVLLITAFLVAFGVATAGIIITDYLRSRILERHHLQAPLMGIVIAIAFQYIGFIWLFSELSDYILFRDKLVDLYVFAQVIAVSLLLLMIAFLSKD